MLVTISIERNTKLPRIKNEKNNMNNNYTIA